jgi:hypothetical protein
MSFAMCLAAPVWAEAPERSIFPTVRPIAEVEVPPEAELGVEMWEIAGEAEPVTRISASNLTIPNLVRPLARSEARATEMAFLQSAILVSATRAAPRISARPSERPEAILVMGRRRSEERARGSICGDLNIQGEVLASIPGRISGCGIENPVRVRAVSGVTLSTPATMDCTTATALRTWIENGARPAVGSEGGGIASLRVVAHYACRTRNNQAGARISEHGKGRAIDIAGIGLADGSEITVLTGWGTSADGAQLSAMHSAACGPFGTVLGPEANRFHRDHFHFDTARYRSGTYCR